MLRDRKGPIFSIQKELLEPQYARDCGVQNSLPDGLKAPGAKPLDRSSSRPQTPACCLGAAGKAAVRCLKDLCVAARTHRLRRTAPRPGVRARVIGVASARVLCSYRDVTGSGAWSPAGRPAEVLSPGAPPRLGGARSATRFGTCEAGRVREGSTGQGRPLVPLATAVSCRRGGLPQTQGLCAD